MHIYNAYDKITSLINKHIWNPGTIPHFLRNKLRTLSVIETNANKIIKPLYTFTHRKETCGIASSITRKLGHNWSREYIKYIPMQLIKLNSNAYTNFSWIDYVIIATRGGNYSPNIIWTCNMLVVVYSYIPTWSQFIIMSWTSYELNTYHGVPRSLCRFTWTCDG